MLEPNNATSTSNGTLVQSTRGNHVGLRKEIYRQRETRIWINFECIHFRVSLAALDQ